MKRTTIFALSVLFLGCNNVNRQQVYEDPYQKRVAQMDSIRNLLEKDTLKMSMIANEFDEDTIYYEESYRKEAFSLGGQIVKSGDNIKFYVLAHTVWTKGNPLEEIKFNVDGEKFTFKCGYYYNNKLEYVGICNEFFGYDERQVRKILSSKKCSALFVYQKGNAPVELRPQDYASLSFMYHQYIIMSGHYMDYD